jgi:cell division protein FtsZ
MSINLKIPDIRELKPRITVFGAGGAGGNAVNNMITSGLQGVEFVVANTDAQALASSKAERVIQMGVKVTEGLGAGSQPEVGRAAAEEVIDEIRDHLAGAHMVFVTAGMGGGTGTGAAPVVARCAKEMGILTVGVVTKPFHFEGLRRMRMAEAGIAELQSVVDTLLIIPNQNLFRVANEKTTFADAFAMADQVLYSGVACVTDLMVKEGLINLDFADVRAVMREMGKAMMGTGEASGEKRALAAAEAAIANPLIDDASMKGAKGLLISITGGRDLTLYEVDEAATRIREEVDQDANIIVGATFDEQLEGIIRVAVVATGIENPSAVAASRAPAQSEARLAELAQKMKSEQQRGPEAGSDRAERIERARAPVTTPQMARPPHAATPGQHSGHAGNGQVPAADAVMTAARIAAGVGGASADEGVTLRPIPPKPSLFPDPVANDSAHLAPEPQPGAFIPPPAEHAGRGQRMPRIDEFPLPGQNQLRASRDKAQQVDAPEKRRAGLLQRLAAASFGRRDDDDEAEAAAAAPRPVVQPMQRAPESRPKPRPPVARPPESRAADPVSEYGKRGPHQPLDPHGRQPPVHNSSEGDHYEIPAFLRRQVN